MSMYEQILKTIGSKKIGDKTIMDFISVAIANGVDTYELERMIVENSKFTEVAALNHIEAFLDGRHKVRRSTTFIYKGKEYPSKTHIAREVPGMTKYIVDQLVERGVIYPKGVDRGD